LSASTDGITEACNPSGEEFGLERLKAFLRRRVGDPPSWIPISPGSGEFAGEPYGDDRTILILRRQPVN
jgi:hypothetical protein